MATVEVRELEIPAPSVFAGMTFPAYRHLLRLDDTGTRHREHVDHHLIRPLALAAWQGNLPVGLALAELPVAPDGTAPQLLSAFVTPELRGQGIGTALVAAVESEIRARGFDYVETVYTTGKPGIDAMERVLAKRQWAAPTTRAITVRFFPEVVVRQPWFEQVRLSAPDCEIVPWAEMGAEARDEIRRTNQEARWVPPGREPWTHDLTGYDHDSSVGIRKDGAAIGWVITHRVSEDAVRFSCAFVREDAAAETRLHALFAEAVRRVAAAGVRLGTFVTPVEESGIPRLLRERCPDAFEFIGETRGSVKWLSEDTVGMGAA